jgi:hypothetical protein
MKLLVAIVNATILNPTPQPAKPRPPANTQMMKRHCFERARLQPRRKCHIYDVALATEGIFPRHIRLFQHPL